MKKVFYLVAASMLMTSCLKDRAIEAYNEDFVSVFGETDPLHTWKMVENQSVEVNVDKPSRVKIYVKAGNAYRLAADYENVSGTQSLSYDAPAGCEDIHVTVDGVPYQKANSRTESKVAIEETGNYKYFTSKDIYDYYFAGNTLPEDGDNIGKLTGLNYKVKSDAESYLFYPVYWGAEYYHSYGLYYYDANGIQYVDFIQNFKKCGLIQRIIDNPSGNLEDDANWIDVDPDYAYKHLLSGGNLSSNNTDIILRSKSYKITSPIGTQFGFYVDVKNQGKNDIGRFYSDPKLNDVTKRNYSAFAYLIKNGNTYITVEDSEDTDYNDFVFVLEGTPNHVVEDPIKYIYAVEDLGGTNDFDFNDIVFSVSHVSGQEDATVQPLAAGGIYPAYIYFNDSPCANEKEFHSMFGQDSDVMVNTTAGTTSSSMVEAEQFSVNVGARWSNTAVSYRKSGNGFSVKVEIPGRVDKDITSYGPGTGVAPQMLVLSENWLWPTEKTRISKAYKEFGEWGASYSSTTWDGYYENNSWISKHTNGLVVNWK